MILRRLAEAISGQNWFTVVLEILIVVIGIFIGLQVDDWNQVRKDRQEEIIYLNRLLSDLDDSVERQRQNIGFLQHNQQAFEAVINILESEKLEEGQEEEFERGLIEGLRSPGLYLNRTTLNELKSSGSMGLISDIELRYELGQLDSLFDSTLRTVEGHIMANMRTFIEPWGHYVQRINQTSETPTVRYSFAEMVATDEAYRIALNLKSRFDLLIMFHQRVREETLATREKLSSHLSRG